MLTYDTARSDMYHFQAVKRMLSINVNIFVIFGVLESKRYSLNLLVSFLLNKSKVGIPRKII